MIDEVKRKEAQALMSFMPPAGDIALLDAVKGRLRKYEHESTHIVYFLIKNSLPREVIYVGISKGNMAARMSNHYKQAELDDDWKFDDVEYMLVPENQILAIERSWTHQLRPKCNNKNNPLCYIIKDPNIDKDEEFVEEEELLEGDDDYTIKVGAPIQ